MSVMLTGPGALVEAAHVPLDLVQVGVARQFALDLYAQEAHAGPTLAASVANWVEASLDAGLTWTTLGDYPPTGLDVGAMTAGQRLAALFRLTIPALTQMRTRAIQLLVGEGIGETPEGEFDGGLFMDPYAGTPAAIDKGTF